VDGPAGAADGSRADLCQLDGDARLGAEEGAGSTAGAMAAGPGLPRRSRPTLRAASAMGRLVRSWLRGLRSRWSDGDGPLQVQAAEEFAGGVAPGRVPPVRMIRARLHVGQPRAQRVRAYLAALSNP
jgi:hypothetical protein